MASMPPLECFLEKNLLRDVKLLRLDSRLLGASGKLLMADGARADMSALLGNLDVSLNVGDTAPSRLGVDAFGVVRFLLGNRAN